MNHQAFMTGLLDELDVQLSKKAQDDLSEELAIQKGRHEHQPFKTIPVRGWRDMPSARKRVAKKLREVKDKPIQRMIMRMRTAKPSKAARVAGLAALPASLVLPDAGMGTLLARQAVDAPKWANRARKQIARQRRAKEQIKAKFKEKSLERRKAAIRSGSAKMKMLKKTGALRVRPSKIHGEGLFTTSPLPKGMNIGLGMRQVSSTGRPDDDYEQTPHAKKVNHSGRPNMKLVREGDDLFMVTTKPVRAGKEITSDYGRASIQVARDFLHNRGV